MNSKVNSIAIESYNYESLLTALHALLDPLGGIKKYVKPGMTVLLKPNLLSARIPEKAVTTHPALVRVVAEICVGLGAKVLIGDSPGGIEKGLRRVWNNTGMTEAAKLSGAELVGFEEGDVKKEILGDREYHISRYAFDVDFIISLSKLKTHVLTNFTGAVKNCYGFVPGLKKSDYHKKHPDARSFSGVIVDVFSIVKPGLHIMDGGLALEGDGPASGNPRWLGYLFASEDAVALDSSVMNFICGKKRRVWPTELAAARGLGIAELSRIDRKGPAFKNGAAPDFRMPGNFYLNLIPYKLVKAVEPLVWVRPAMDDNSCIMCGICEENCPQDAIYEMDDKMRIDYDKCIKCMCCHELCPEKAVFLNKSKLAKLIN